MRRRLTVFAVVVALGISVATVSAAAVHAETCIGSWSVGIGGLQIGIPGGTGEDSRYLSVDQPVGYDSGNPISGYRELDRLILRHRYECPADHIEIVGHSEGSGIAHAWITANETFPNVSAVLIADPKRAAGPGGAGLAGIPGNWIVGWPLAGVDSNFGAVPVLEVCHSNDWVCNFPAGPVGYLFESAHTDYDFTASDYPSNADGVWFQ